MGNYTFSGNKVIKEELKKVDPKLIEDYVVIDSDDKMYDIPRS